MKSITYAFTLICILFSSMSFAAKENKPTGPFTNVVFETSLGKLVIELYPNDAPITVTNFLKLVDDGYFVGTIFHRVMPNFVVQGGGFTFDLQPKETRDSIKNEADNDLLNLKGTLSMARSSDPDSASTQFFINIKDNESLDFHKRDNPGYAVFGKVIEGFETVKKIEREPRGLYRAHPEAPNYPVIVEKAYRQTSDKK